MLGAKLLRYPPSAASVSTCMATMRPSRSKPMRATVSWSRACASERNVSLRVAVHLTGRPRSRAAQTMVETSTANTPLEPKAPPTSGETTRSVCSGICSV